MDILENSLTREISKGRAMAQTSKNNLESEYKYDNFNNSYYDNGALKEAYHKGEAGTSVFNYDKNGNLTKAIQKNEDNEIMFQYEAQYNKDDVLTEEELYDYKGNTTTAYDYFKYDDEGKITKHIQDNDGDGNLDYYQENEYFENGQIKIRRSATKEESCICQYNEEGKIAKEEVRQNDTITKATEYEYDKDDNAIKFEYSYLDFKKLVK